LPELPEVETIAGYLAHGREGEPPLPGRRITGVKLLWGRTLASPSPEDFERKLVGQVVEGIGRRGKFLLLRLSQDTLLIHLRMSGDIRVEPSAPSPDPHDRLILEFENGLRIAFNDPRKFGRVWLSANPAEILDRLGPEPLDEALTPQEFYNRLQARRRQLKPLLLDQQFLAGLGNIYTDEALNLARLHPLVLSDALSLEQAGRLLDAIRRVLLEGIRRHGASIDWVYRGGDFQNYFRAYHREGKPCPECGTPIVRLVIGQRSTHFCPRCQRLEG
jgi:formamidopyrimidine-DNA glycosylase